MALSANKRSAKKIDPGHATERQSAKAAFLEETAWAGAQITSLAGDASTRSYDRLTLNGRSALLMNAPPGEETAPCPRDASPSERQRLGYNALARLAGPNLAAFTTIAETLRSAGLSAPEVYAVDPHTGFALIEDLGDALFARVIPDGQDEDTLYASAVDALIALNAAQAPAPETPDYQMLEYDRTAMEAEVALLTDWYIEYKTGSAPDDGVKSDFQAAFAPALDQLSTPHTIVLRDFHAENLIWLSDRKGQARVGVIDFQDGLYGHAAYDLVSLLEDARRDVSPVVADAMVKHYLDHGPDTSDPEQFLTDYAVLGAQRNAKILGIFARLITRDKKDRYQQFLPRVEAHFRRNLSHPALADAASFMRSHFPDLIA
ncbi:MAG: phosphotransferase [Pseudomonadota bacterium]